MDATEMDMAQNRAIEELKKQVASVQVTLANLERIVAHLRDLAAPRAQPAIAPAPRPMSFVDWLFRRLR